MRKKRDVIIHPGLVNRVLAMGKERNTWYSDYIVLHFRATGNLAPGCDAKDFYRWVDEYIAREGKGEKKD